MNPVKVIITESRVYLSRQGLTTLDREVRFDLEISEIDPLVANLQSVKKEMAKRKRAAAVELENEANKLDPCEEAV